MANYSGFNAETKNHLLLDAGAFYINYGTENEKLMGATQGGGEFTAVPTLRQIAIDGVKGSAKGLKVLEAWEVTLTANFLEVTPEILKMALGVADVDSTTNTENDVITGRTSVLDSDYVDNIAWVGNLSGSNKPVVIEVYNALSREGITLSTQDNAEGIVPIVFEGHFDPANLDKAPFQITYPKLG